MYALVYTVACLATLSLISYTVVVNTKNHLCMVFICLIQYAHTCRMSKWKKKYNKTSVLRFLYFSCCFCQRFILIWAEFLLVSSICLLLFFSCCSGDLWFFNGVFGFFLLSKYFSWNYCICFWFQTYFNLFFFFFAKFWSTLTHNQRFGVTLFLHALTYIIYLYMYIYMYNDDDLYNLLCVSGF